MVGAPNRTTQSLDAYLFNMQAHNVFIVSTSMPILQNAFDIRSQLRQEAEYKNPKYKKHGGNGHYPGSISHYTSHLYQVFLNFYNKYHLKNTP